MSVDLSAKRNTYEHVWGYFKKMATPEEKKYFFVLLDQLSTIQEDVLPYL